MAEYNRLKVYLAICEFLRGCALAQLANLFVQRSVFWEVSSRSGTSLPFADRSSAAAPKKDEKQFGGFGFGAAKLTKRS